MKSIRLTLVNAEFDLQEALNNLDKLCTVEQARAIREPLHWALDWTRNALNTWNEIAPYPTALTDPKDFPF